MLPRSFISLLLLVSLAICCAAVSATAAPAPTQLTLVISSLAEPLLSPFVVFSYPLTVYDDVAVDVTIDISNTTSQLIYQPLTHDFETSLSDLITAPPSPAKPSTFLIAHSANGLVQYNRVVVNASSPSVAPTNAVVLGDATRAVTAYIPRVGQHDLLLKYLFHLDVQQSYYGISYVTVVEPGKTRQLYVYVFRDIDVYSQQVTASYVWTHVFPDDSWEFGLVGGEAAVDQQRGLVYLSIAFWQSDEPQFDCGWLLTYDGQANAMTNNVSYPLNVSKLLDYSVELTWSHTRQALYGAIFYDWYAVILDRVNPATGSSTRIMQTEHAAQMDLYDNSHVLDETTGNWYFASMNNYVAPDWGNEYVIFSLNIDTGIVGQVNNVGVPFLILNIALSNPMPTTVAAAPSVQRDVSVDEEQPRTASQAMEQRKLNHKARSVVSTVKSSTLR